jgi:hypothetical protein
MKEEIELGEQDEVTYAIVARLPAYALWNLLDCRDEDGVPLMTVIEWLRFIRIYLRSGSNAGGDDKGASQSALDRQGVSRKMAYDRHRGTVRQLEMLHQEPGTPFVTGGFDSPAMASPDARSDQVRGSAQDRGVGAGMMKPW